MSDHIVIKAKIKEIVGNYQVAGDYIEALDKTVESIIKRSIERAEANHRKTVMAKDL